MTEDKSRNENAVPILLDARQRNYSSLEESLRRKIGNTVVK